ncbi:hypothetical protein HK103_002666 [Boothiomyces macroporosus]|uniref:Altered inheritance of mitochondria protein 24, mitochondrial n=1 Tax=Boothiomyces macroporosus TaxID=261099 RepID=A0AAD5UMI7_9FUNG|nr:hypothetical protein HK103_002666 [Boothiomyces macroporosus]
MRHYSQLTRHTAALVPNRVISPSVISLSNIPKKTSFEIKDSNLTVNLAPNDSILTAVGSIVASSSKIDTLLGIHTPITRSITRKLSGGSFFLEKYSTETGAVVALSPKQSTIIEMDGTRQIVFKSDSFIASTDTIDLQASPISFGLKGGYFHLIATGQGVFSIKSSSVIELQDDQECFVEPSRVVAWDLQMRVEPVETDALPMAKKAYRQPIHWMSHWGVPDPIQNFSELVVFYYVAALRRVVHMFRYWVLGERGVYRIKGPGQVFLK